MKITHFFFLLLITFSLQISAQEISEGTKGMNLGTNNSFTISFPDYEDKMVESVWKDFSRQFKGRTKKVKRSNELFTDNATVPSISPNPIDLYTNIKSSGSGSEMTVWVDLGGIFINSSDHPNQFEGVEELLMDFAQELKVVSIENMLDEQNKEMKTLERDLKKLQNDNDKFHKQIEEWKEKIAENERLIEQNLLDQEAKTTEIQNHREKILVTEDSLAKEKKN